VEETCLTPFSSSNPKGAILRALFSTQRGGGTFLLPLPRRAGQGLWGSLCTSARDTGAVTDSTLSSVIHMLVANGGRGVIWVFAGANHALVRNRAAGAH